MEHPVKVNTLYSRNFGHKMLLTSWHFSANGKYSSYSFFICLLLSKIIPLAADFDPSTEKFAGFHRFWHKLFCFRYSLVTNRVKLVIKVMNFLPPGLWNNESVIVGNWHGLAAWSSLYHSKQIFRNSASIFLSKVGQQSLNK